jgi:uncharacterized membrane protein
MSEMAPTCIVLSYLWILSSHLHLHHPFPLFRSDFYAKILYVFLISPMHVKRPIVMFLLDLMILIFSEVLTVVVSLRSFPLHPSLSISQIKYPL